MLESKGGLPPGEVNPVPFLCYSLLREAIPICPRAFYSLLTSRLEHFKSDP